MHTDHTDRTDRRARRLRRPLREHYKRMRNEPLRSVQSDLAASAARPARTVTSSVFIRVIRVNPWPTMTACSLIGAPSLCHRRIHGRRGASRGIAVRFMDRPLPRTGRAARRRSAVGNVRVGTARGARRHVRPPPQRIAVARRRHPMGGEADEDGRSGERAHGAGEGPALGPRPRERRDRRPPPACDGDARPRQQRGHAR